MYYNTDQVLWENAHSHHQVLILHGRGDVYSENEGDFVARFRSQADALQVLTSAGYIKTVEVGGLVKLCAPAAAHVPPVLGQPTLADHMQSAFGPARAEPWVMSENKLDDKAKTCSPIPPPDKQTATIVEALTPKTRKR